MEQISGTLELSNGTRLEYVAVSLPKKSRSTSPGSDWGGVFKSTGNVALEMLYEDDLVLHDGSRVINVVHVSPTAESSLALFHGVDAFDESDDDDFPLEAA
jgi:hypothetical protein